MSEWKPISEAPRDGTVILFYVPTAKKHKVVSGSYITYDCSARNRIGEVFSVPCDRKGKTIYATHFQPLPTPPEQHD